MNCWTTARIFITSALICCTTAETKGVDDVCKTADCMKLGLELSDAINASADPCDDFYDYVCKKWKNKTKIPPYLPSYGHLWLIRDEVAKKINETLRDKEIKQENQTFKDKIVMAYNSCMKGADELHQLKSTLNTFGLKEWPMMLNSSETINWTDIYRKIRSEGDMSFIFSINLTPYLNNTSQRAISIERYGMVPSPDFNNNDTFEAYKKFITQTIILFSGMPENVATEISHNILDFEANITKRLDDLSGLPNLPEIDIYNGNGTYEYDYDNDENSTSNKELVEPTSPEPIPKPSTKLKDIEKVLEQGGWLQLIKDIFQDASVNLTDEEEVNVPEPSFLQHVVKLLNSTPPQAQKCIRVLQS